MSRTPRPRSAHATFTLVAVVVAALIAAPLALHAGWSWLLASLAGVNAATFALYAWDKRVAATGGLRVPEALLHLLALLGGTPAALVARPLFRHKTRKLSFRVAFAVVFSAQIALVWWWLNRS